MKLLLSALSIICVFVLAGLFFTVNAEEPNPPHKYSVVGSWLTSVGDVHYEFNVDETHVEFMDKKSEYTVVYEGKWALMKLKLKDSPEVMLLIQFETKDKVSVLSVGAPANGDAFLNRK